MLTSMSDGEYPGKISLYLLYHAKLYVILKI